MVMFRTLKHDRWWRRIIWRAPEIESCSPLFLLFIIDTDKIISSLIIFCMSTSSKLFIVSVVRGTIHVYKKMLFLNARWAIICRWISIKYHLSVLLTKLVFPSCHIVHDMHLIFKREYEVRNLGDLLDDRLYLSSDVETIFRKAKCILSLVK